MFISSAGLCCLLVLSGYAATEAWMIEDSAPVAPPEELTVPGDLMSAQPLREAFLGDGEQLEPPVPLPATLISAAFLPKLGAAGFGVDDLDLRHTLLLGYDEIPPLNITPGAAIHRWSAPTGLDLPEAVYDVYLDFYAQPWQSERGSFSLGVTPGIYGDFQRLEGAFQWSGWALASRHLGPQWTIAGGAAYVRQLRASWLPIGGVIWAPNETTRLELLFPRPKLTRRLSDNQLWTHWGYVAGHFGGGAWSVADTPQSNVMVSYSDLRLLAGWEAFSLSGYEWRGELGYVFARDLSVNNTLVDMPTDTFIAQLMFGF